MTLLHKKNNIVVSVLAPVNLDAKRCRAQGCDGAENMSGCKIGLVARVLK